MSTAPTDRIDALSRDLITIIKDLRASADELRAQAEALDVEADEVRAELADWNLIRSYVPTDAALTSLVAAMDRIDGGVGR